MKILYTFQICEISEFWFLFRLLFQNKIAFFLMAHPFFSLMGFQAEKKPINFVENHPINILIKFGFNLPKGFREED